MDWLINWSIIRVPNNWFMVGIMVVLGLFALHFGLSLIHGPQSASTKKTHPSLLS